MAELTDLMSARGVMLTLHGDSEPPTLLYADSKLDSAERIAVRATITTGIRGDFEDGIAFWRENVGGPDKPLYLMPVDRLAGHSRIAISLLFDNPDASTRTRAERIYRERRPFATGFFQLWQHNRLLEQRARSLESVLDQTAIGVVLLDRRGHVIFANQTADEILATGNGIGHANGALRATSLTDGVNLQAALAHGIGGGDPERSGLVKAPLLAFRRQGAPALIAAILRAQLPTLEAVDVAAVMYLVDPRLDIGKMLSPLCRLYGLSTVETNLVCHLASGETITSAALAMRVKEQTARGYLKAIFVKTATKRQTELVVLMLSSVIRMKRDVLQEALTSFGSERALGIGN